MSFFSSAKAKLAASKLAEEQLYAQAAEEVSSGQIRQGLWAKAIAETGGDEAAAKAQYLKLRVEIMKAEAEVVDFAVKEAAKESNLRAAAAAISASVLPNNTLLVCCKAAAAINTHHGLTSQPAAVLRLLHHRHIHGVTLEREC